jgi:hypothetical protein
LFGNFKLEERNNIKSFYLEEEINLCTEIMEIDTQTNFLNIKESFMNSISFNTFNVISEEEDSLEPKSMDEIEKRKRKDKEKLILNLNVIFPSIINSVDTVADNCISVIKSINNIHYYRIENFMSDSANEIAHLNNDNVLYADLKDISDSEYTIIQLNDAIKKYRFYMAPTVLY